MLSSLAMFWYASCDYETRFRYASCDWRHKVWYTGSEWGVKFGILADAGTSSDDDELHVFVP